MPGKVHCAYHRALNAAVSGKHGCDLEGRKALFKAQGGCCPVCTEPLTLWNHVDHDHTTGRVRGLLHARCNLLIRDLEGHEDDVSRALEYLSAYASNIR